MALKIYFCDSAATLATWEARLREDGTIPAYVTPDPGPETGDIVRFKVSGGADAGVDSKKTLEAADGQFIIVTSG